MIHGHGHKVRGEPDLPRPVAFRLLLRALAIRLLLRAHAGLFLLLDGLVAIARIVARVLRLPELRLMLVQCAHRGILLLPHLGDLARDLGLWPLGLRRISVHHLELLRAVDDPCVRRARRLHGIGSLARGTERGARGTDHGEGLSGL